MPSPVLKTDFGAKNAPQGLMGWSSYSPWTSGKKVPQVKHNLRQENPHSTFTLHTDQPTHVISSECGIHLPGIQNAQSESFWYLTKKGNKSKFR